VPEVKGAPQEALELEQTLLQVHGITDVKANPTTGNVLILFASAVVNSTEIVGALKHAGYLRSGHNATNKVGQSLTNFFVQSAVEMALERLVLAFV
jgi:copper chaperone CopZ